MVLKPSYLNNGNPHPWKESLYIEKGAIILCWDVVCNEMLHWTVLLQTTLCFWYIYLCITHDKFKWCDFHFSIFDDAVLCINLSLGLKCLFRCGLLPLWHFCIFSVTATISHNCQKLHIINSLWFSDTIWQYGSGSTVVQVMVLCLTAPNHYLNQCVLCHSR